MPSSGTAIPRHVAIIMDGNGRWATGRGWHRLKGHERGAKSVRAITGYARKVGVKALTLYAFSTENWARPDDEVTGLMKLLGHYLQSERRELLDNNIKLIHSGDISRLPEDVRVKLRRVERATDHCEGMVLNLALSYGSRQEILGAVREIAEEVQAGNLSPDDIDEHCISSRLDTAELPELDLVIRTSGEMRLSNFLLWQVAYSELYITDVSWPEFDEGEFDKALASYRQRQRRFGKTGAQIEARA